MENFRKKPRDIHVYQYGSPKRKGRSVKELGEGRIINKKQISEEFITDNGHERRMREIKRTNK